MISRVFKLQLQISTLLNVSFSCIEHHYSIQIWNGLYYICTVNCQNSTHSLCWMAEDIIHQSYHNLCWLHHHINSCFLEFLSECGISISITWRISLEAVISTQLKFSWISSGLNLYSTVIWLSRENQNEIPINVYVCWQALSICRFNIENSAE